MMNWTLFHFLRPYWLLAFIPWLLMLLFLIKQQRQGSNWLTVCDAELLPYLLQQKQSLQTRLPLFAASFASALTILALAGPTWQQLPTPAFRNQSGLVIALDLSLSMEAMDIKPSRLVRARYKIADILKQRKDGQTALLVYSGDAFTVTPLTNDNATIASQLEVLTPHIMPSAGSNPQLAISKAVALFKQAGLQKGQILLVTDGIQEDETEGIISRLENYTLAVLAVGTEQGAPIGLPAGDFLKDEAGNIVTATVPLTLLQKLAHQGGGVFAQLSDNDSDVKALLQAVDKPVQDAVDKPAQNVFVQQWDERGVYLLWLIAPLAALQFRRGLLVLAFLLLLPLPENSYALGWQDLWQTQDQQAQQAFLQRQYSQAAAKFENPHWKAAAAYKAKDYQQVLKSLKQPCTADAYYNQGNGLAQSGQLEQALNAYNQALKLKPNDADALYNKKLVEEALKKQQQQQKQDKNKDKDKSKDRDKQEPQKSQNQPNNPPKQDKSEKKSPEDKQDTGQGEQKPQTGHDADKSEQKGSQEKDSPSQSSKEQNQPSSPPSAKGEKSAGQAKEDEKSQANAQWLNRVPDDPAGLLRRKFKYQYGQGQRQKDNNSQAW